MLTEIEAIDHDGENTSEEYLNSMKDWSNFDPDQNVWIAESNGSFVGFGQILPSTDPQAGMYVVTHPTQRRKGLGSQLLEKILARACEFGANNILVYTNESNEASKQFLKKHGFTMVGSSGSMKTAASIDVPAYEFPNSFVLKRYSEINEPRLLLQALNICYLDMWGHQHNDHPSEQELKSLRFLNYYDANDILLLFGKMNEVIGICSLKSEGKKDVNEEVSDLLDGPGIVKSHRDQNYQHQLVLAGIQHLRKKGTRAITLEFWGDTEKNLQSYRELGFEMINRFLAYNRELL